MNLIQYKTNTLKGRQYISDFFTKGHKRSLEAKKNIAASFLIKGTSIAISMVLVPLTINYVNPTQYGIWLTLSSIVAWFSFFDIGFGNGLRNKFAEAKATGNLEKAKIYISTTYAVLFLIFSGIWLLFFVVNFFLDWSKLLNAPSEMAGELSKLALIVFSFFCMQMVLKTINIVLIADQKNAKAAFFDMMGQLIALAIIFSLTRTTSGSLLNLGMALGFAPIFILIVSTLWFYNTQYKSYAPAFKNIRLDHAKDIMKLGGRFFIIQIAAIVIYQTSNIIISQICGPQDVTVYNIAFKYFGVLSMAFSIILAPFWSAFTEAQSLNDYDWMISILKKLKLVWVGLVIAAIILLALSDFFYVIWIGHAVKIPFMVSLAVFAYVVIFNYCAIFSQITAGLGKIKLQFYVAIVGCFVNIPFSIYLGNKIGIVGIILSSAILSLTSAVWNPIQIKMILNKKAKGIWNE
ncbi:MAG TPA: oligosaccharide flippase family protein [Prolixibacteraceae bacterium]|jgi:O-antigen/teichoic acid export membrane protein